MAENVDASVIGATVDHDQLGLVVAQRYDAFEQWRQLLPCAEDDAYDRDERGLRARGSAQASATFNAGCSWISQSRKQ